MKRPTTGTTKKPTTPSATPIHWVDGGTPAISSRRPGTTYFTTVPTAMTTVATPNTAHAVAPPSATAQRRTPATTRTDPGRIGTTMPTRPTATSAAARRVVSVMGSNLSQGRSGGSEAGG